MADERRDLAAELQAMATAWIERNRPAIEALGKLVQDPRVRAHMEACKRGEIQPEPQRCHCLCGKTHPDDKGVCDGESVTTRHYDTELLGPVDVPLCAPCAAAQFLAEVT